MSLFCELDRYMISLYPCGRYAETQRKMCFREPVCQDESELPESAVPLGGRRTAGCRRRPGFRPAQLRSVRSGIMSGFSDGASPRAANSSPSFSVTEEAFQLLPLRTALSADARMRASVR